ncbi:TPA: desulfoferrodoxin [Candidatus Woesearchaeota archaeon]|nr:desulfoferrodoxin [Candidatus Woesearchaeota archaeon]
MTQLNEVYKCNVCGNIVEVVHAAGGQLVCCGQPMQHLVENTTDAAQEKHVPVKESSDKGVTVKVGSVPHPMEAAHYIEWVQVIMDGWSCRRFLKPGEKPEAVFCCVTDKATAREYCNLHGLWKS